MNLFLAVVWIQNVQFLGRIDNGFGKASPFIHFINQPIPATWLCIWQFRDAIYVKIEFET